MTAHPIITAPRHVRVKPPVRYYGGKTRLAVDIAALFPPHRVYVEPFAGALAVLLAKSPSTHEVINDLDGDIVTFWRVLRDRPDDLARACALTPYARDEYSLAAASIGAELDDLERARRWWVRVEQSFNATPRGTTGWGISTSSGRGGTSLVESSLRRLDRFAFVADRIRGVAIENRPAVEVIERLSRSADAVVYCDPPYVHTSRTVGGSGERAYQHEMFDDDHRRLAAALVDHPGTVVLSGYPSELYDELYGGWWRLDRPGHRGVIGGNSGREITEVLWSNRDLSRQLRLEGIA